jgi:alkaline phosphatase
MLKCWGIHTKKSVAALVATMMLAASGGTVMAAEKNTSIKNVIILIPDGMASLTMR